MNRKISLQQSQNEYHKKFMLGVDLVDSSYSLLRTEKSLRESIDNNESQMVKVMECNIRLIDEITKNKYLEVRIKELEEQNQQLKCQVSKYNQQSLMDSLQIKALQKENTILKKPGQQSFYNLNQSKSIVDPLRTKQQKTEQSFNIRSEQSSLKKNQSINRASSHQLPPQHIELQVNSYLMLANLQQSSDKKSNTTKSKLTQLNIEQLIRRASNYSKK